MTLKRVMYVSRARHKMTHGELSDLLAGARMRNETHQITGILVYDSGNFAQVLEGPRAAVNQLLKNIADDPRHDDYTLISEGPIEARYFRDWSMDWANLADFSEGEYRELRQFMADHTIADRTAIYGALVRFLQAHAKRQGYPDPRPAFGEFAA